MKSYESSAKTIEEAISAGLEKLGASISDVTIDVLGRAARACLACSVPGRPRYALP